MTRINAGINPINLSDKHLLAEHREIKRIPNAITNGKFDMKGQPMTFTLGKGHVKFFYDKCLYLLKRYIDIRNECYRRGFKITNYVNSWNDVPGEYMGDYIPTDEAINLINVRIQERNEKYLKKIK